MKVIILAGGLGTRIMEESHLIPKPMISIGGKPILWHIMKHFSFYGFNEFIICCGYKASIIKDYFSNYFIENSDIKVNLENGSIEFLKRNEDKWIVSCVDTGLETGTAARLKRVQHLISDDEFLMTYGDGVSDINLQDLITSHRKSGASATVTAVTPEGRYGSLVISNNIVDSFSEKNISAETWVSGGFFVLNKCVLDQDISDDTMFEQHPLSHLAARKQLHAFKHTGFWASMDTLRDRKKLEELWSSGSPPWKLWND